MVSKRAVQLRLVRPVVCALSFLASLAGQATDTNCELQIANRKFDSTRIVGRSAVVFATDPSVRNCESGMASSCLDSCGLSGDADTISNSLRRRRGMGSP